MDHAQCEAGTRGRRSHVFVLAAALCSLVAFPGQAGAQGWVRDIKARIPPDLRTTDDPRRVPIPNDLFGEKTKIVLVGGRLFDGTGKPARSATIFIDGNKI